MRRPSGRAPRTVRRRPARPAAAGEAPAGPRLLPATPTGAVVARELHTWQRDPGRRLTVLLALLIAGLNLAVPAIAFHLPAVLPWAGLAAALIMGMGAANLYGEDGTAFWLTRMVPGVERADVRGRQLAWLLVVAPLTVILTVALTFASGRGWGWPSSVPSPPGSWSCSEPSTTSRSCTWPGSWSASPPGCWGTGGAAGSPPGGWTTAAPS
jgi:hypothetical protein